MQLRDDLALIGNCQFSAIVDRAGGIVWCCLPRFDSEPVFSSLLHHDKGGRFVVTTADGRPGFGRYLDETNVLETTFETDEGSFRVIDFAPRFVLNDRMFRPTQLYRIVEPLSGTPRVRVDCAPRIGWSKASPATFPGSSHVSYGGYPSPLRLTTDIPLTYLDGRAFALTQKLHLALAWGPPIDEPIEQLCDRFLGETMRYWQRWVKHCSVPPLFQDDLIRSALALKLHCFEDTGAIVTSMTRSGVTQLDPRAPPDGPVCDLGDARHALAAFRRLGHFEERERFVEFLLNIVGDRPERVLSPVYRIDGTSEQDLDATVPWGPTPARPTSAEVALALTPLFVDDRYQAKRSKVVLELLQGLARKAVADADVPAAGLRESRAGSKARTFSSLMCWAAADRMANVATSHAPIIEREFRLAANHIRDELLSRAWNEELGSFVSHYGGRELDPCLLQMASLRLLAVDDPRLSATIDVISKQLVGGGEVSRERLSEGWGAPGMPVLTCTFWLVEALAVLGRIEAARELMKGVRVALMSTSSGHADLGKGRRPASSWLLRASSSIGFVNAVFAASPRWTDLF